MNIMLVVIICLILHIILCVILYLLIRLGILVSNPMVMVLAWLVPLWGPLCLAVLEIRSRGDQEIREEAGLEKLKINDQVYRSILMEEEVQEDRIVPLEEALLVNDTGIRRELMMEIMYGNPELYVSQLQEARMNDDTEVVHYAVTALTEMQKEYDLKFQELDKQMAEEPEDEEILDRYLGLMEQYIGIGLLEGNTKAVQMKNYSNLLERKIENGGETISDYLKKIDTDLSIREYEAAYEGIQAVLDRWPKEEAGYLRLIQYYSHIRDRNGIDRVLAMIRHRHIFLSPEGRGTVRFWGKDGGWEKGGGG